MTRAKAAALATDTTSSTSNVTAATKKPLQSKNSALNGNTANFQRKRAALGDVSNVTKSDVVEAKEMKKALNHAKVGLVSKASQTAGVQKGSRTGTSRPVLGAKETNRKATAADLKRPASGSGVMGGIPKKRNTSMSSHKTIKEEVSVREEVEPPTKKPFTVEVEKRQQVKIEEEVVVAKPSTVNESNEEAATRPVARELRDLDMEDIEDPLMAAEYAVDIFKYLREIEPKTQPNPDYMDYQDDLEWKMRGILVDWLIEVHTRFHLLPETLFLAVNIIDRFLSAKVVQLDRLQLVGVTAMFIASKYEEVLSPHVANFRHVADDGFTEQEILSAERLMLSALDYNLSYPNPMNFLRRISKADNYDIQTRTLGKYLMEISLVDDRFLIYPPSLIAAGAMYLAREILERDEWVSG